MMCSPWSGFYYGQKQETKMTREEAIKIMDSSPSFSGAAWIARFEALGLIKFDEHKEPKVLIYMSSTQAYETALIANAIVALDKAGYEVKKKS